MLIATDNYLKLALAAAVVSAALLTFAPSAEAQAMAPAAAASSAAPDTPPLVIGGTGKLLLTGGVSSIDGAAGGGLTPWAVTAGYATNHELNGTAHLSRAVTNDYALTTYGAAVAWNDRVELSIAHQEFNASVVVPGTTLRMDIGGMKVRLLGDAVLEADSFVPQVAVGAEWKHVDPGEAVGGVLDSVSARRTGVDGYVSATKLFVAPGVLVNATLRATRANQNGLLGFGSAESDNYHFEPEFSLAKLLSKNVVVGAEYRYKPNNLAFAGAPFKEDDWKDLFVAWAPNKHVSFTLAYVDLGNIVGHEDQHGAYLSMQLAP